MEETAEWLIALIAAALLVAWNMPDVLVAVSARCLARRDAIRVHRQAYRWHLSRARDLNPRLSQKS